MKLVMFRTPDRKTHAGVVHGERVTMLDYPSVLELLRDPDGLAIARRVLELAENDNVVEVPIMPIAPGAPMMAGYGELPVKVNEGKESMLNELVLLAPVPDPPSVRDFYAFEQHVKAARALRGAGMIPEWYEIPTFYFTNNSEIYGHDEPVPYPAGSNELDIELEIACIIGREGKDIPVEEAGKNNTRYNIMNDWRGPGLPRLGLKLKLGPRKRKGFCNPLGSLVGNH